MILAEKLKDPFNLKIARLGSAKELAVCRPFEQTADVGVLVGLVGEGAAFAGAAGNGRQVCGR